MSTHSNSVPSGPRRSPQELATLAYRWQLAQDRFLLLLTCGLQPNSAASYRSALAHFRGWLDRRTGHTPTLAVALVDLFAHGHDAARALVEAYRDDLTAADYPVGTTNQHVSVLRSAARVAREMGEIKWDLNDVHGLSNYYPCSNNEDALSPKLRVRGPNVLYGPKQTIASIEEAK